MFKKSKIKMPSCDVVLDETNGKHIYTRNNLVLPSVSEIMSPISNTVYGFLTNNRSELLENAAYRGTMVHLAVEIYNLTGKESIAEPFKPYLDAYKRFCNDYRTKYRLIANEAVAWHRAFNYAGTVDLLFEDINDNNKIVLVDVKSTATVMQVLLEPQLTLYAKALEQDFGSVEQKCLHLKNDGTYDFIGVDEYTNWLHLILQHNYIKEHFKNINFNEIEKI